MIFHRGSHLFQKIVIPTTLAILILFINQCNQKEKISALEVSPVQELPVKLEHPIPAPLMVPNPVSSDKSKKGGGIRVFAHQYPKSLNYYLEQFSTTAEIFKMQFESLASYHPITLEPIPHLASDWSISPDKKTFIFHIDKNAKWSDGKPVTAHDVLFTFNLIMNPANNTAIFRIGLGRFEVPVVIDDFTISFTAKKVHWNNFDEVASGFFILPKHYFEGKEFNKINDEFPVVSGPYKIAEAKQNRYIRMRRRGDYWQKEYPFVKNRYNFDEIFFKVYNEEPIAFQAMLKGDIDLFPSYRAATWVNEAKGEKFDKFWILKNRIFNYKPIGFQGWALNMRRPIFSDRRVRKAIAYLINRKTMIEKFAYNEYEATNSYYPDYYLGENEKLNPNEKINFNPEAARALLKEAGWKPNSNGVLEKDGKEFEITILDRDKSTEKYFTFFMEDAKKVGIKAKIESTDLAGWSARMDKFDFDLTWTAWGGGVFKDPEQMWYSKYANETGQHNYPGFENKKVDELIEEQKSIFDVYKRNSIVKEIDKIIYKEHPYILLWHLSNTRIIYWNRFGMPDNPLGKYSGEAFAIEYWWFDKDKNSELDKSISTNVPMKEVPLEMRYTTK
ncbi:MAG: extracellular solute-binding protein [Leptospiraceae bacterium]|nr:extracellular solute-binding protein [Leptospiraceae bacterium]